MESCLTRSAPLKWIPLTGICSKLRTPTYPIVLTVPCWTRVIDVPALRRSKITRADLALAYRQLGAGSRSDIPTFIPTTAHHWTTRAGTTRTVVPAQRHSPTSSDTTRTTGPEHPDLRGHQPDPADGDRQTADGMTSRSVERRSVSARSGPIPSLVLAGRQLASDGIMSRLRLGTRKTPDGEPHHRRRRERDPAIGDLPGI